MQIRYHCPNETCVAIIEYQPLEQSAATMECPRCHRDNPIHLTDSIRQDDMVDHCVICKCKELFVRKDFPRRLGLLIVVVSAFVSLYYFRTDIRIAMGVLVAAVLLDLLIYSRLGLVTTCYACRAEFRGGSINPAHEDFNLTTSEKF